MIFARTLAPRLCVAGTLALAALGCSAPDGGATPAPASSAVQPAPAADARPDSERALRAMFPEIQGEITRDSIARALAAESAKNAASARAPSGATGEHGTAQRVGAARAALDQGDFESARALIGDILADQRLARARDLIAHDDARTALAVLDEALADAPRDARLRALHGRTSAEVGAIDREPALVEIALADFLQVAREHPSPEAWIGASRAARWLGKTSDALALARNAVRACGPGATTGAAASSSSPDELTQAEHALADASFDACEIARRDDAAAGPAASSARAYFDECKSTLERSIARSPRDAWAWRRLCALHEAQGALAEAQAVALRGLDETPADEELHQCLARASSALGGRDALLAAYAQFASRHANVALGEWYPAVARFEGAVETLSARTNEARATASTRDASGPRAAKAGDGDELAATRAAFEAAERGFARCRTHDAKYAQACRGYEALCRDGIGWCAYHAGDLEGAHKSFLSMEDVVAGGLASELEGKLASGVVGLHWIGAAYAQRAQSENSLAALESLERAGKIYDFLHEYQPQDANWANDSGFFNRDTAVALERKAQAIAEPGRIDEANRLLDRARELMEKSYRAYVDAARLAPDDVRIQNDTGLILVHYLQRDVERAQKYLMRAVELGEKELPDLEKRRDDPALSPDERERQKNAVELVESALGDAYQNLGVLALTLQGDAKTAKAWFRKCLATGRDPRAEVSGKGGYLEQCDDALAGRKNALVTDATRWAAPKSNKKPQ
jgi:tetratricopeptide (TPR) repeat protein